MGASLIEACPQRGAPLVRQRPRGAIWRLGGRAEPNDILGRAFNDQRSGAVALDQHGDPATFEVERDFVDLPPRRRVDFLMSQDGFVERTFQPALEMAVQPGERQNEALSLPVMSTCFVIAMRASVRVPVLSVQSTSIAPRLWIEGKLLTITF